MVGLSNRWHPGRWDSRRREGGWNFHLVAGGGGGGGGGRVEFPGGQMVKVVAPALLIEREMPEADWGGISPHYLQVTTTYLPRMVYL